jgi:Uma2 family endonuclease
MVELPRAMGEGVRPPATPSVKFTYDDFLHFPDDGKRHEIIDGEHQVTPSPNTKHQAISFNLSGLLWAYLKAHPIGRVFAAPFDVVLSNVDVVAPDLLYVSRGRLDVVTDKHVRGVPDLVVEIISPGTRRADAIVKRRLYERVGVSEYWAIDPRVNTIDVHRRRHDSFAPAVELRLENDDVLTTPLLPAFSARLAEIFAGTF